MSKLNEELTSLRIENGYSIQYIADVCNTAIDEVIAWEEDQTTPSTEGVLALANLYDVSIDRLLGKYQTDSWYAKHNVIAYIFTLLKLLVVFIPLVKGVSGVGISFLFNEGFNFSIWLNLMLFSGLITEVVLTVIYIKDGFRQENDFRRIVIFLNVVFFLIVMNFIIEFGFTDSYVNNFIMILLILGTEIISFIRYDRSNVMIERTRNIKDFRRIILYTLFVLHFLFAAVSLINDWTVIHESTYIMYLLATIIPLFFLLPIFMNQIINNRTRFTLASALPGIVLLFVVFKDIRESQNDLETETQLLLFIFLVIPMIIINFDLFKQLVTSRRDV